MFTKVYAGILQSEIPLGGLGRALSAEERNRLVRHGITCGEGHIVVRLAVNTPKLGRLYQPDESAEQHQPMELVLS